MPPCLLSRETLALRAGPGDPINVGTVDAHILQQVIIQCVERCADSAPFDCGSNFLAQPKDNHCRNIAEERGSGLQER
jgi:hypothetical protein